MATGQWLHYHRCVVSVHIWAEMSVQSSSIEVWIEVCCHWCERADYHSEGWSCWLQHFCHCSVATWEELFANTSFPTSPRAGTNAASIRQLGSRVCTYRMRGGGHYAYVNEMIGRSVAQSVCLISLPAHTWHRKEKPVVPWLRAAAWQHKECPYNVWWLIWHQPFPQRCVKGTFAKDTPHRTELLES